MIKKLSAKRDCRGMDNDEIIEAILEDRGIEDLDEFLRPSPDNLIDFDKMKGLQEAYEIIDDAITLGDKILVLSDCDGDGVNSSAIIARYLRKAGANVNCIINKGKKHGCSELDLSLLDGYDVFIVVDSLDNDPEVYRRITNTGIRLVVVDHHIAEERLLNSDVSFVLVSSAVDYPNPDLSGAGVCLKLVLYMDEMNLTDYADDLWVYAAMGIVSDMCSLESPENRYIVSRGLRQFDNPAVKKMIGTYMFDTTSIAFSIGPLLNACMRTNNNELAMNALLTDDEDEIVDIVKEMQKCREEQNVVVDSLIDDLLRQGEEQLDKKCMFFFIDNNIDADIGGLLGNKLLSVYQKPLFILRDKGDRYEGSMRSVGTSSFLDIANGTHLCLCQGHENASGAFIDKDKFEEFKVVIEDVLKDIEFCYDVTADIEIEPSQINDALVKNLTALNKISGAGFKPITVLMRTNDYTVSTFSTKKHLKIVDSDTGVLFTKWNDMSWQTMDNNGEFIGVGTLAAPTYGKKKFYQLTLNEYTQQND